MRSGTIHRLHVSEFGKICAKYPDKAVEVITGSIPAAPLNGILIIESTAEGKKVSFTTSLKELKRCLMQVQNNYARLSLPLFAWWDEQSTLCPWVILKFTDRDNQYFERIEAQIGRQLTIEQRAWYVATRDADFSGSEGKMWQEYPSTPEEAFQQSTEGLLLHRTTHQSAKRKQDKHCPHVEGVPVNTFWDIGSSDGTAIWFHQRVGQENQFIDFAKHGAKPYSYFVRYMQSLGYVWGKHYLPHDATHKRQQGDSVKSPKICFMSLGLRDIEIVPRVDEIQHGIQATRDIFSQCWFDETNCKRGLWHICSNIERNGMTAKVVGKTSRDTTFTQKQQTLLDSSPKATNFRHKLNKINPRPLSWKVV